MLKHRSHSFHRLANRRAAAVVFALNGLIFGTWATRIPDIRADLDLDAGELGIALAGPGLGALLGMPLGGFLVSRLGSSSACRLTLTCYLLTIVPPAIAGNLWALCLVLVLAGVANGALDVAMNAQGAALERASGDPTMSWLHGWFSVGGVGGALIGTGAAGWQFSVLPHFALIAGTGVILTAVIARHLAADGTPSRTHPCVPAASRAHDYGRADLLLLGALTFLCLLAEGSLTQWAAVYLREAADAPPGLAAAGYATFMAAMVAGRLGGNRFASRYSLTRWLQLTGVLLAIGVLVVVTGPALPIKAAGFALCGLGLSISAPMLLGTAGRGIQPGRHIAAVSVVGYLGLLAGPAAVGAVAQSANLHIAMLSIGISGLALTAGTPLLRHRAWALMPQAKPRTRVR